MVVEVDSTVIGDLAQVEMVVEEVVAVRIVVAWLATGEEPLEGPTLYWDVASALQLENAASTTRLKGGAYNNLLN